jgi:di/tripeptidase
MGTTFEEIYDLAKIIITDYRLDSLYQQSQEQFMKYFKGLLVSGMSEFIDNSLTDLSYTDDAFNNVLSVQEKSILAYTIVLRWYESIQNVVLALRSKLTSRQFKQVDISSSMKQRQENIDKLVEKINDMIVRYQLSNYDKL